MFYVLNRENMIIAMEHRRPAAGAYPGLTVVYSEGSYGMEEYVDPDAICTRMIRADRPFIAGDGVDQARVEISDYGAAAVLDICGDVVEVPLENNYAVIPVISRIPPVDLVIKGVQGPLASCEARIYVR